MTWLHTHTMTLWRGAERSESMPLHVDEAGIGHDEQGRLRVMRDGKQWHVFGPPGVTAARMTVRIGRPPRSTSPARERLAVRFPAVPGRSARNVILRLTADERALIERAAGNLPVSTWIREACGGSMAGGSVGVRDRCLEAARKVEAQRGVTAIDGESYDAA